MPSLASAVQIIDIRRGDIEDDILKTTLEGLRGEHKSMPTLLLYDEKGLNLFEDITYLDDYYPTNAEIEVLKQHAAKIASRIPRDSRLIELGSGNLRKVDILLQEFEKAEKSIEYYALDLSLEELHRTFAATSSGDYVFVKCFGLHGTYDDALAWLSCPERRDRPTCVLSLGSSIGNFTREEAAGFLRGFSRAMGPADSMLIGLDGSQDSEKIYRAYNDSKGITHQFYRNGLKHANRLLGYEAFKEDDWEIVGEYDRNTGAHQAYYSPRRDVSFENVNFQKGERIPFEAAMKYSSAQRETLWRQSGLLENGRFSDSTGEYHIHMLSSTKVDFPTSPEGYASDPVPTIADWDGLWVAWEVVTRGMIPHEELLSQPIKLRNALVFYLGHIPTFLDIHLTRATKGQPTEPRSYSSIFERGIDPDVDNPELCHDHSAIPDEYPPVSEILEYQQKVRARVHSLIASGEAGSKAEIGEALWLGFEHEAMHLETFLYMLLQSEKALPPPGEDVPDFSKLAEETKKEAVTNEWFTIPESTIEVGMNKAELSSPGHHSWDNERPVRSIKVPSFSAQARPITNGEYSLYLEKTKKAEMPASWTTSTDASPSHNQKLVTQSPNSASAAFLDGKYVKTVFGPVPLRLTLDWPVSASYDEISDYATWMNGRIPTLEEAKSLHRYANQIKGKDVHSSLAQTIPAVNGHLSNDGVEETPPPQSSLNHLADGKARGLRDFYIDLKECNVGFKKWHPTPVTQKGNRLCGQSDFGGLWEWTSSVLERHEGFEAMELYPGYTADFFDGKHNIVLGGSWATHPRLAGRISFINWYQRNYPYAWVGARLVRDL